MPGKVTFCFEPTDSPDVEDSTTAVLVNGVEVAHIQHCAPGGGYALGWWDSADKAAMYNGPIYRTLKGAKERAAEVFGGAPDSTHIAPLELRQALYSIWACLQIWGET